MAQIDKDSAYLKSKFIEFCPQCGTIFPLPVGRSAREMIECGLCHYSVSITSFHGLKFKTKIVFNDVATLEAARKKSRGEGKEGPIVDRKCSKCGHEQMYYKTLQTRSADEGQTVFYYCVECGAQENENS